MSYRHPEQMFDPLSYLSQVIIYLRTCQVYTEVHKPSQHRDRMYNSENVIRKTNPMPSFSSVFVDKLEKQVVKMFSQLLSVQ